MSFGGAGDGISGRPGLVWFGDVGREGNEKLFNFFSCIGLLEVSFSFSKFQVFLNLRHLFYTPTDSNPQSPSRQNFV